MHLIDASPGLGKALLGMKRRIAVLALAVGFYAAPTFGAVAMDSCPPSCPHLADAPCETGEARCVSMSAVPCCDMAPSGATSQAKQSTRAPTLHLMATAVRSSAPTSERARASRIGGDLALLTSPLRLSVVLLI